MNQAASLILQKADVNKLPSLPHVLLHLLELCQNENLDIADLSDIIKQDAGLYARFMSIYNHRHCQLKTRPRPSASTDTDNPDIQQILQNLDLSTVKSIITSTAAQQFFSRTSLQRTDFLKQHWQHSLLCAQVAYAIARHCNYHSPDEAYTAGLLHDIGQLSLETAYPDKYTSTFVPLSEDDYFRTMENDEFKTTHQQISATLLRQHGCSSFMVDAVLYHHETISHILDAHPLVKIVNLANSLSNRYFKEQDQQVFVAARELLGLDRALLLEILENATQRTENMARSLGIQLSLDSMNGEASKALKAGDEFKQLQLAEQIRNIALLSSLYQHLSRCTPSHDRTALLNIISQHTDILFGINQNILFLYDPVDEHLHAITADNQPAQLADISIPLKADRSLVAEVLINKQAGHSFDDVDIHNTVDLSVVDKQLLSFTRQKGFICLPLMIKDNAIGTLLMATDRVRFEQLWKQLPLLMYFVTEIAHSLRTDHPGSPMNDADNNPQLEQRIREVQHEVRNPLSIMNNYLGILSHKLDNDKPAQEDVQTIKSEIERINLILNRLTEKEIPAETISPIDINSIISDLTHVFQSSLFTSKNIQISLELDSSIKALPSNANTLKQIYTNLIKNAVEALPANGQLMVYTQDNVNVDGKEHIEISVTDNGPGIDTQILPKLFSPVDSTKGNDHAGLGLTIVKNLVGELHGSISCRSSSKGTSFHILLPKSR